jgi:hypothetical protein
MASNSRMLANAPFAGHVAFGTEGVGPVDGTAPQANGLAVLLNAAEQSTEGPKEMWKQTTSVPVTLLDTSESLGDDDNEDEDGQTGAGRWQEGTPTGPMNDAEATIIPVICNGIKGDFHPAKTSVTCFCAICVKAAEGGGRHLEISATDFEKHAGAPASH